MGCGELVIKFLSIILSWPVIIGGLLLIFGKNFKNEIKNFLTNIVRIKISSGEIIFKENTEVMNQSANNNKTLDNGDITVESIKENPEQYLAERKTLLENIRFENYYNQIFGTQVGFLLQLDKLLHKGLTDTEADFYYIGHYNYLRPDQQMLANRRNYFGWLLQIGVIKKENSKYYITEYGKKFLQYIQDNRLITLYRAY